MLYRQSRTDPRARGAGLWQARTFRPPPGLALGCADRLGTAVLRARRVGSRDLDLLEYQGKQLFAKHGVPVPDGRARRHRPAAVEAAEEVGYPVRGQGAGADRQARQGRRDQDRQRPRRGAGARRGDPRHGHPRLHRPRGLGRARLEDRRRVLRLDHPRPLGEEAAGDALAHGRHGRRGDGRDRPVGAGQAPHRARRGVHGRGRQSSSRSTPGSTRTRPTRSRSCWSSCTTSRSPRTRP